MKKLLCKLFGHKKSSPTSSVISEEDTLWVCERCGDIIKEYHNSSNKIVYEILAK